MEKQQQEIDSMVNKSMEMVSHLQKKEGEIRKLMEKLGSNIPKMVGEKNGAKLFSNGMVYFPDFASAKKFFDRIK